MCRSKRRDHWDHTANLLALLINVNRDPKKTSAVSAESIHPFEQQAEVILTTEEKNELLKDQMAKLLARSFQGKCVIVPPVEPANAELLRQRAEARRNGKSRNNSSG